MSDEDRDREIRDVMSQEKRRGRAPIDPARKREALHLARVLDLAMKEKNERGFSEALRKAGIFEGSQEWQNAWKAYRAYWR